MQDMLYYQVLKGNKKPNKQTKPNKPNKGKQEMNTKNNKNTKVMNPVEIISTLPIVGDSDVDVYVIDGVVEHEFLNLRADLSQMGSLVKLMKELSLDGYSLDRFSFSISYNPIKHSLPTRTIILNVTQKENEINQKLDDNLLFALVSAIESPENLVEKLEKIMA